MHALTLYRDHPVVHVPDEMWYRFDDRRYSIADEYGDHCETRLEVNLTKFYVRKHTPKGVWLTMFRPAPGNLTDKGRFVLHSATRRFACATIEEAKVSFIARKRKQAVIHRARADNADRAIQLVEKFK